MVNKRAQLALVVSIGILAIALISLFLALHFSNKTAEVTYGMTPTDVKVPDVHSTALSFNNLTLTDRTNFNATSNTCTATYLGMSIVIKPCVAQDIDGKNIEQYVNFSWSGAQAQNTSWIFIYDSPLQNKKVELEKEVTEQYNVNEQVNRFISNYIVNGVTGSTNLGTPDSRCEYGNTNNTKMYQVQRGNLTNVYCFTTINQINATTYSLSGNAFVQQEVTKSRQINKFVDVSDKLNNLGTGLLGGTDQKSYYRVNQVVFQPGDSLYTKWSYTPVSGTEGKWHILGFDSTIGLTQSIVQNKYLYVDPWWNSNWAYCKNLTVTGGSATLQEFPFFVNITMVSGKMLTNFQDVAFVDAACGNSGTQMPHEFDYTVTNSTAGVWVRTNSNLSTGSNAYSMYYGNPSATVQENPQAVWNDSYVAVYHFSNNVTATGILQDSLQRFNLTAANAPTPFQTADYFGYSWKINGVNNTINGSTNTGLTGAAPRSVFTWSRILTNNVNEIRPLIFWGTVADNSLYATATWGYSAFRNVAVWGINNDYPSATATATNAPLFFANTWDGSNIRIYLNNSLDSTQPTAGLSTTGSPFFVATPAGAGSDRKLFDGYLDEIQVSNVSRSQAWVNRTYQNNNVSMWSMGSEQTLFNIAVALLVPSNNTISTVNQINFSAQTNVTGGSGIDNVTIYVYNSTGSLNWTKVNTTTTSLNISNFSQSFADGVYTWGVFSSALNASLTAFVGNNTFTVDTNNPSITINSPSNNSYIYGHNSSQAIFTFNATTIDTNLQACWYNWTQGTTKTIYTCNTQITLTANNAFGAQRIYAYANDTGGNTQVKSSDFIINQPQSPKNGFETDSLTYSMVIYNQPSAVSSGSINFNGTVHSATVTALNATTYSINATFDQPLVSSSPTIVSYNWTWNNGSQSFSSTNDSVQLNLTNFTICSAGNSVKYLNFTFADETSLAAINATVDGASWNYYLGTGSINRTLVYSNTGGTSPSYAFCYAPPSRTLVNELNFFRYSNTGYPQRTYAYTPLNLSNLTTNTTLYLLSSSSGVYSSILVVQGLGTTPIVGANVLIELQLNDGSYITVFNADTDSSGIVTAWLNPNSAYRYTVSADGFITQQFTLNPSQSIYTVRLQAIGSTTGAYNSSLTGYKWFVTPQVGQISPGLQVFNLTLVAYDNNLVSCRFSILNASNLVSLNSTTGGSSNGCNLTISYNLTNGENLFGKLEINNTLTDGLYQIVDTDWKWVTEDIANNSWNTVTNFFSRLTTLSDFGNSSNRQEFSRIMWFFLVTTILLAIFTYLTGFELQNPGVALILLWFVVAVGSVAGFFTFNSASPNVNTWTEQYGILIIFSMFAIGFIVNQIRRQS